jgi:hypothetical protein
LNGSSRSVQLSRNQPENTLAVWLIVVGLFLSVPCAAQAESATLTPAQVVFQWLEWYPKDLSNAATLTTPSLRNGLSQKQWVEKNEPLLNDLQFKYLDGKVLEEEHDGVHASVTVQVRLYLVIGEVRQVETYSLKKVKGHWRIDSQKIQEDRVIGRTV